jgi:hypothetical protein
MTKKVGDSIHVTDTQSGKLKGRVTTKGKTAPTPAPIAMLPTEQLNEQNLPDYPKPNMKESAQGEETTFQDLIAQGENEACCGACGLIYEITEAVFNARVINNGFVEYSHPDCDLEMEYYLNNLPETCIGFIEHPHVIQDTITNEDGTTRTILMGCSICQGAQASENQGTTAVAECLIRSGIKNVTVWNSSGFVMLIIVGAPNGKHLGINNQGIYFYSDAEDEGSLITEDVSGESWIDGMDTRFVLDKVKENLSKLD